MAMIRVVVRPEHGIDLVDIVGQKLRSQIGRSVDQDLMFRIVFQNDRNPAPAVARFIRVAISPVVADPGDPGRGARAEHNQLHERALAKRL